MQNVAGDYRHILRTSVRFADTAIRNKWTIGYATYRKRMKKEDIQKEHRSLKKWLHKNGKDTMTAISIGLGKGGYVYIFFVSTSADG